jgi:hypothetical protein
LTVISEGRGEAIEMTIAQIIEDYIEQNYIG